LFGSSMTSQQKSQPLEPFILTKSVLHHHSLDSITNSITAFVLIFSPEGRYLK